MTNFNETFNPSCLKNCPRTIRKDITDNDICSKTISSSDKLSVRCVGEWSMEKIHYLNQYLTIFADGMRHKWEGKINYVEICSGPGRCVNRSNGIEFDGTALTILNNNSSQKLNKALFFDINKEVVLTLNKRISNLYVRNAKAFIGDYTKPDSILKNILNQTGKYGLFLVFIDPTDCSLPFNLIATLKRSIKNIDFIINLASGTDFNRNIRKAILTKNNRLVSKYSNFLNSNKIFVDDKAIEFARTGNHLALRTMFRDIYTESLKDLGYKYFEFERIRHYYDLLFASSHSKGLEFWRKVNNTSFDRQRRLF